MDSSGCADSGASASFDRFDICEAYLALETDYNRDGWVPERPSCQRRMESIGVQLHRIQFRPSPFFCGYSSLTENGQAIYNKKVQDWGLPEPYIGESR